MKTSTILWVAGGAAVVWFLLSMQQKNTARAAPSPEHLRALARSTGRISVNLAAQRRRAAKNKVRATR